MLFFIASSSMISPPSTIPRANRSIVFGSKAAGLANGISAAGRWVTATQTRSNLSDSLLTRGRHVTPSMPSPRTNLHRAPELYTDKPSALQSHLIQLTVRGLNKD